LSICTGESDHSCFENIQKYLWSSVDCEETAGRCLAEQHGGAGYTILPQVFIQGDELERLEGELFGEHGIKQQEQFVQPVLNVGESKKERNKMLAVLLAMAVDKYGYDPEAARNTASGSNAGGIPSALEAIGLSVDAKTVREYLKEAYEINKDSIRLPRKLREFP
jgi:hypothetical protein